MENNQQLILLEDLGMIYPNETTKLKRHFGLYKCFCGAEFKTRIQNVKSKLTQSCGCYQKQKVKEIKTKHNLYKHRLYRTWKQMITRCTNSNSTSYKDYGARGITVCDEWLDINNFINDMYPTFIEGLTTDRENNNKGYSKDNCRWATKETQSRNKRILCSLNTSGYRGVYFDKDRNKWRTMIRNNSKKIHLGFFDNPLDGAIAYDNYVIANKLEHTRNFS